MFWECIKPSMRILTNLPHMSSKTVFTLFLDVVLIYNLLQNNINFYMPRIQTDTKGPTQGSG